MLLTTITTTPTGAREYVIYSGSSNWHFFSSNNLRAYKRIIRLMKFKKIDGSDMSLVPQCEGAYFYGTITNISFTSKDQIPHGAKPIIGLSNGSKVKCYYLRQNNELLFFRPNPNYKSIYKPLSLKQHIRHSKKYGTY